jgi:dihydropteroate synthase
MATTKYINLDGRLTDFAVPAVMGILNATPDSFYAESRKRQPHDIAARARQIVEEGGAIIDVGAYSSRPNAEHVAAEEEMRRLAECLEIVRRLYPEIPISVDTFRAEIAERCVADYGVNIINDISGGAMDAAMFDTVARLGIPYILMHIQGTPQTMQTAPHYDDVVREVFLYFAERIRRLRDLGVKDIILDPGFGFGKTLAHNYQLFAALDELRVFELPVLVGVSRKSMITRLLDITPQEALNGTTVLHTMALLKGANILRVHDVRAAVEAVKIVGELQNA